jgi:hypothetical protein
LPVRSIRPTRPTHLAVEKGWFLAMLEQTLARLLVSAATVGCTSDPPALSNNVSRQYLTLTLTPATGGEETKVGLLDQDQDIEEPLVGHPLDLAAGDYVAQIQIWGRGENERWRDITADVRSNGDEYQVLFIENAAEPPLSFTYADADANGLPIGLSSNASALPGDGTMYLQFRSFYDFDGERKISGIAEQVQTLDDSRNAPGDNDFTIPLFVSVASR